MKSNSRCDLRAQFPISYRFILMRSLKWIVALIALCFLVGFTEFETVLFNVKIDFTENVGFLEAGFIFGTLLVLLSKIVYSWLFFLSLKYFIEGDRLVVVTGVLIKAEDILPLKKITGIHVRRTLLDYLCGLCRVEVLVPGTVARIDGFARNVAESFHRHLAELSEPDSDISAAMSDFSHAVHVES